MSEKDQVKPYHAKTSGQETADAVADVLQHAKEREAAAQVAEAKAAPKGQPKWMLPLALNLGVLAVYFLVAQPRWLQVNPIEPPPAAEQLADMRGAMFMEINGIESFRLNNGRLPTSFAEYGAGAASAEMDYQVNGDNYLLIATIGEETLVFNSATDDAREFLGGAENLVIPG